MKLLTEASRHVERRNILFLLAEIDNQVQLVRRHRWGDANLRSKLDVIQPWTPTEGQEHASEESFIWNVRTWLWR